MENNEMNKNIRSNVFIVSLCAALAYGLSALFITSNLVEYTTLPKTVVLTTPDNATPATNTRGEKTFYLPVKSNFAIDTTRQTLKTPLVATRADILFHQNPTLLVWLILICIMVAVAAGSVPVSLVQITDLKTEFNLQWDQLGKAILYAFFLALFLILTNGHLSGYYSPPEIIDKFGILFKHGWVLPTIVLFTILLASPAFAHVFLIGLVSGKVGNIDKKDRMIIDKALRRMRYLNLSLQNALQLLAVIVVFSVLTSTALGQAMRATMQVKGFDVYPKEVSIVYGLYFTLFLCIIYVPVYFFIKQNYLKLKEMAWELKMSDPEKNDAWYNNQFGQSKFEGTAIDNLKLGFTMLSPLLSGFLPKTLGFFN
jgi:hypothetical protein